jgi:hypothetical protein
VVYGGLKVGKKRLFIHTVSSRGAPSPPIAQHPDQLTHGTPLQLASMQGHGVYEEMEPTCVLDCYVHESCQRTGIGHALFEVWVVSLAPCLCPPAPGFAAEAKLPCSTSWQRRGCQQQGWLTTGLPRSCCCSSASTTVCASSQHHSVHPQQHTIAHQLALSHQAASTAACTLRQQPSPQEPR